MKLSEIKSSGYVNVVVDCPLCHHEITFNRVSDLDTFKPISGANVFCPECKGEFWINGDSVNERHEAIVFDCHDLLRTKRYMNCILNVCQAYEMFFSLYLRVNLLYLPFGSNFREDSNALRKLNELSDQLSNRTEKFGFVKMRKIFLRLAIEPKRPSDLDESRRYINEISDYTLPKDAELKMWPDKRIAIFLIRVKETQINKLRNDVVHKKGYRPKNSEAEHALNEARAVLFPLTSLLNLHDDVNWYC